MNQACCETRLRTTKTVGFTATQAAVRLRLHTASELM